jgi:hypothetical protein
MAELATSSTIERAGIETFVPIKPDRIDQLMRRERFRLGVSMTIPRLWRRAAPCRSATPERGSEAVVADDVHH